MEVKSTLTWSRGWVESRDAQLGAVSRGTVVQLGLWLRQLFFSSPVGGVASLCLQQQELAIVGQRHVLHQLSQSLWVLVEEKIKPRQKTLQTNWILLTESQANRRPHFPPANRKPCWAWANRKPRFALATRKPWLCLNSEAVSQFPVCMFTMRA